VAYNVASGNITVDGPAGVNGPGAGIQGTSGSLDLIAQTINLNAPVSATGQVNLITGNQLVTPMVTGVKPTRTIPSTPRVDINATGAISAVQNATLTAGGNLNAASVATNGVATLGRRT